jgi:ribosomal-protein-alanine N-acetyltransferase
VKVRLAEEGDVETIRALESEAFGFTWAAEVFARELGRSDCLFTVGEVSQETVAMASLNWILDEVHLMSIAVAPAWRGRGLARQILGENLAFCRLRGLDWMTLEVKWDNPPALALYKHYGFTTVGRRKKYYRDGQDARIMWSGRLLDAAYQEPLRPYRDSAAGLVEAWTRSRP